MKKLFHTQTLNIHHTLKFFFFFVIKNILISNYNLCKLLTFTPKNKKTIEHVLFTRKIEELLSTNVSKLLI